MTAEFDFDTYDEWAAKYNTPAPAAHTFAIGKVAAPQITWPTAASVKAGSPLSDSALSGGSTEYGSFSWKDPALTAQAAPIATRWYLHRMNGPPLVMRSQQ